MSRKNGIRYFPSKNGYFTDFQRNRYRLATGSEGDPDVLKEAEETFAKLFSVRDPNVVKRALKEAEASFAKVFSEQRAMTKESMQTALAVIYLIQTEPNLAPLRVKCGATTNLQRRLATFRAVAPDARLLTAYSVPERSYLQHESALLEKLPAIGCKNIKGEVFLLPSLDLDEVDKLMLRICPTTLRVSMFK
jgi:hypothetical protein